MTVNLDQKRGLVVVNASVSFAEQLFVDMARLVSPDTLPAGGVRMLDDALISDLKLNSVANLLKLNDPENDYNQVVVRGLVDDTNGPSQQLANLSAANNFSFVDFRCRGAVTPATCSKCHRRLACLDVRCDKAVTCALDGRQANA